jgi:hypothetical protein
MYGDVLCTVEIKDIDKEVVRSKERREKYVNDSSPSGSSVVMVMREMKFQKKGWDWKKNIL